ncbi:MAG: hypothetical protein ACM3NJ_00145 [Methanobacterium sp.]
MFKYPKVIASSVVRGAQKGESHGGLYMIDLDQGTFEQIMSWENIEIAWEGSGRDRGLRGIAFYNGKIYIASSNEILVFNQQFEIINRIKNKYLCSCHEIAVFDHKLYISSTLYDAILIYDLQKERFMKGYQIKWVDQFPRVIVFDHNNEDAFEICNHFHINNVFVLDDEIYFSGLQINVLFKISKNEQLSLCKEIPRGTHNVQIYQDGLLMNDTPNNTILYMRDEASFRYKIKRYKESDIIVPAGDYAARQRFGRGLTTWGNYIIGGSSPGTISIYEVNQSEPIKTVNITMDIRNSIHGLEIWPF